MIGLQLEIFLLIAIGWWSGKSGKMCRKTRSQLTDLVINVVLPCSIIRSFMIEMNRDVIVTTFLILVISFGIQILYALFNLVLYRWMDADRRNCCKYGTMVSNAGFLGMPITQGIFGSMGLLYASIFLIPQRIFMWSYGLSLFAGKGGGNVWKKVMTHPCIIAVFIGIALMIAGSYGFVIPSFLDETLKAVASCNTALSMIVVGGILSDVDFRSIFDRDALIYSMIRLIVLPLVIMVILRTLNQLPTHSPSIIFDLGGVSRLSFLENECSVLSFSVMYLIQN